MDTWFDIPDFYPDPAQEAEKALRILDSGTRREFKTGAVRDANDDKGRCDLLPLQTVADVTQDVYLLKINRFLLRRSTGDIADVINGFATERWGDIYTGLLELSIHFSEGAKKYEERNWEKGIPLHCFVDSAVRHYIKFKRGDKDEPHDRAFVWNLICLLWTYENHHELDDLPRYEK